MARDIQFPIGSYQLHPNPNFNYQLNRAVLGGFAGLEEVRQIAPKISTAEDWGRELEALGELALSESRVGAAITYFRMAELFMYDDNPKKIAMYRRSKGLFYSFYKDIFESGEIKADEIPYENGSLPVWVISPETTEKGSVIFHGGYDSYIEEYLGAGLYIAQRGYKAYLFEGPGQGAALREKGIPFTKDWHLPVSSLMDRYGIKEACLVGMSLGAALAPRAAAYEKRVKQVIALGILPNFFEVIMSSRSPYAQKLAKSFLKLGLKPFINGFARAQMAKDPMMQWGISHGLYSFGAKTPYEFFKMADQFQIPDIGAKISQDFLLIGAERDHFIPKEYYKKVIDSLPNARSITYRLFTKEENAETHCNAGNMKLVLDFICAWLGERIKNSA